MNTRHLVGGLALCGLLYSISVPNAAAQHTAPPADAISAGAVHASADGITINGTIGQAGIGPLAGRTDRAWLGFWYRLPAATTSSSPKGKTPLRKPELSASPNPVAGSTTITVTPTDNGPATLVLHDLLGREVRRLFAETLDVGLPRTYRLDASALAAGRYTAVLSIGGRTSTLPLTIIK